MPTPYTLWDHVYQQMSACNYAEQIFCSLTTEMKYLPAFKTDPALKEVHKENYETSYHQNTAAGNLQRLIMGTKTKEQEKVLCLMTVACLIEAKYHQKKGEAALSQLSVSESEHAWLEAARHWHRVRRHWLKYASKTLRSSIPAAWWTQGEALVESS